MFNLGRVFASLTRNILFWWKIKLSGSHIDAKKEVIYTSYYVSTSKVAGNNKSKFWKIGELTNSAWWGKMTVISRYVCTSSFWVRHSTQFQERLARTFRLSACVAFDSRFICWLCSFVFIIKRRKKLSSFFTPKKMHGSWTWKALGWAGKRWQWSGRSQFDDVSCSKFQYHSLTQTIFEMTQFKMPCGTCDPFWLISRLNTLHYKIFNFFHEFLGFWQYTCTLKINDIFQSGVMCLIIFFSIFFMAASYFQFPKCVFTVEPPYMITPQRWPPPIRDYLPKTPKFFPSES